MEWCAGPGTRGFVEKPLIQTEQIENGSNLSQFQPQRFLVDGSQMVGDARHIGDAEPQAQIAKNTIIELDGSGYPLGYYTHNG